MLSHTWKINGENSGANPRVRYESWFSCIVERENVKSRQFVETEVAPIQQSAMLRTHMSYILQGTVCTHRWTVFFI